MVRNAFFRFGSAIVNFITMFISTPLLVGYLGDAVYGVWLLLLSAGSLMVLLDLGMASAITRYIAEEVELKNWQGLESTLRSALAFYWVIAAVILLLHLILALSPQTYFDLSAQDAPTAAWVLVILGCGIGLGFPARVYEGILLALEKHWLVAVAETLAGALRLGLIVTWIWIGGDLVWLAIIHSGLLVVTYCVFFAGSRRVLPVAPSVRPGYFPQRMRELLVYGRDSMLKTVGERARNQGPSLALGTFSTVAVAQYGVGLRLLTYANLLVGQAVQVAKPRFVTSDARNDRESIRQLLLRSSLYACIISGYLGLGIGLLVKDFIFLWVGDSFAPTVDMLLVMLLPVCFFMSLQPVETLLLGLSLHRFAGWVRIAEAAITLGVTFWLGGECGVLAVGAGAGGALLLHPLLLPTYACRRIGLGLAAFWRSVYLRPALTVAVTWALMSAFLHYWPVDSWAHFLVAGCVMTLIYGLAAFGVALPAVERRFWLSRLPLPSGR